MTRTILAGDVGGTHTRLALFETRGATLHLVRAEELASQRLRDLGEAIARFLEAGRAEGDAAPRERSRATGRARARAPRAEISAAAFGVPGPIVDGRAVAPNLPWIVEHAALAAQLGVPVRLVNDLEALATGVLHLPASAQHVLQAGARAPGDGNVAVIAAGTGLGESMLWWDGARHRAIASEGGHADFAPRGPRQEAFARWLECRYGHASVERALSGPGLVNGYTFLRDEEKRDEPAWLREAIAAGDAAAEIAAAALAGRSLLCVEALGLFVDVYAQEAGNLATRCIATGGVFLGGGIAPRILPALERDDRFLRAFHARGVFAPVLERIAVRVICDPRAGLFGAAHCALDDGGA